jgi:hypothetical protein
MAKKTSQLPLPKGRGLREQAPSRLAREIRKEIYVTLLIIPYCARPSSRLYGALLNSLVGVEAV